MSLTTGEILQLYIAYFRRPAAPAGLDYGSGVDATQDAVAASLDAAVATIPAILKLLPIRASGQIHDGITDPHGWVL